MVPSLPHPVALLALLPLLAGGAACRAFPAWVVGVDEVSAEELRARMSSSPAPLVIDVRGHEAYRAGHVPGALNVAVDDLDGYFERLGPMRARPVVLVCRRGFRSLAAAAVAEAHGYGEAYSLAGGTEAWQARGYALETGDGPAMPRAALRRPELRLSWLQQFVDVFAGLTIKPGYMLLALLLIVLLRRQTSRDLAMLRWSLVPFLAGEIACALNIGLARSQSEWLEIAHGAGMIGMNVLLPWALFRFVDERVLRFSDADHACAAQRLCGRCWKKDPVPCVAQRMFLFVAPALAAIAALPLTAPLRPIRVTLPLFCTPWPYTVTLFEQLVEFRLYPVLAILFLLVSFVLLFGGRAGVRRAQLPFFVGFGFLGFALFRFVLYGVYRGMPVWADFWEEATEFLAVFGVGVFLVVFRGQIGLFASRGPTSTTAASGAGGGGSPEAARGG